MHLEKKDEGEIKMCLRDLFKQVAKGDVGYLQALDEIGGSRSDDKALVWNDFSWSYEELFARVDKMAAHLQSNKIGPNDIIGVYTDRTPEMMVSILGILKAGAAFLPLDPQYPEDRIRFMVKDTGTDLILTQDKYRESLRDLKTDLFCTDSEWEKIDTSHTDYELPDVGAEDLAYIIYTSGSTGTPKGVMVTFGNLLSYTLMAVGEYKLSAEDVTLQFGTMNFDVFTEEVFPTYLVGGTLVLRDEASALGGDSFWSFVEKHKISFITLPTAFWHTLCTQLDVRHVEMAKTVKLLVFGGEAISEHMLELWQKKFGASIRLMNTYGPSETTVVVTGFDCQDYDVMKGKVPIGKPFKNVKCYILDEELNECPTGKRGELYLAGPQVAKGYLNRTELTEQRFIPNPFEKGRFGVIYKTGDICSYLPDGNIAFEGRNDSQVKLRGLRIELGEIETALTRLESVKESVVLVREDEPGDKKIVAYLVSANSDPEPQELREKLKMVLAGYMIPSAFVPLKKIPMTVNGKVDKRSLEAPERQHFAGGQDVILPENELEERLLEIWENVLKMSPISVEDDFFDIGGHSLIAVELFDKIRNKMDIQLPLAALIEAPNIREMAGHIEEANRKEKISSPVAVKMNESEDGRPFFCIHGHFGNILFLKELANKLGDKRPFYGIQSVGRNGSEEPLLSIKQMADRYLREMRKIQPKGPYSFGGYCYGTLVARIMAKKLDKMGESYVPIIMIDPQPDIYERILDKSVVSAFRKAANQQRVEVHRENVGENNSLVEKSRYLMIKAGNKVINKFNEVFLSLLVQIQKHIPLPIPGYLKEVEVCNLVAHNQYCSKLEPDFHADVEIILSRQLLSKYSNDPARDWSGFTQGNMTINEVNDDGVIMSDLMFKSPYVDQLAEIISSIWNREQSESSESTSVKNKMTGS